MTIETAREQRNFDGSTSSVRWFALILTCYAMGKAAVRSRGETDSSGASTAYRILIIFHYHDLA